MAFKLTYGTMSDPPQEMHDNFDLALQQVKQQLGKEYPMTINGEMRFAAEKHQAFSPADISLHLATFQKGTAKDADDAIAAAKAAFPNWKAMNWEERVYLMRKFADRISAASTKSARQLAWKSVKTAWKRWETWLKRKTSSAGRLI